MYNRIATFFLCYLLIGAVACKSDSAKPQTHEACTLLSDSDILAVQGEAVADKNAGEHSNGGLLTSQCFYRLPTFSKSINLEVMRPDGSGEAARAAEDFWERRFGRQDEEESRDAKEVTAEHDKEKDRGAETKGGRDEREEKEGARAGPIADLGDEAFWTGSQINGSLYIRNKDSIIRLSIGGPDDQTTKINKARTLAEQVLKRL